jgi:molybdopterin synthase sulfur carrier subunit
MITIEFLGPINKKPLHVNIENLNQLGDILRSDDTLKPWLKNSAVAVNDILVTDKSLELKNGDRVSLLPPVCGG